MRRLLATVFLATACLALAQLSGAAAAPPVPPTDPTKRVGAEPLFVTGVPKDLADLRKLEARVQETLKRITPATVGLGGGSGVIVSKEGLILTVAHVGQRSGRALPDIRFADGKRVKGKVL